MVIETLLGIAIATGVIGFVLIVDCLVSRVSFKTPGVEKVTVLCCEGEAEGLEGSLRDVCAQRGTVYIFDGGMSPEAVKRARLLALRFGATLTDGEDFTKELRSIHGRD